jgi:hypothetical protein
MSAPSIALMVAEKIKVYRIGLGATDVIEISMDAEQAEAMERVLRYAAAIENDRALILRDAEAATTRADQARRDSAAILQATEDRLQRMRRSAVSILVSIALLSLFCIAWAAAIVGALS